jgi:hypothetical protein
MTGRVATTTHEFFEEIHLRQIVRELNVTGSSTSVENTNFAQSRKHYADLHPRY